MTWTAVASLPTAAVSPACCAYAGKLYSFGGDAAETAARVYDPGTDAWSALASSNVGTIPPISVAFYFSASGLIYVLELNSASLRTTYDPVANSWSNSAWAAFLGSGFAGACTDGTKLYGLEYPAGSSDNLPQISVFNPATNTWSTTGTKCPSGIAPNGLGYGSCWYHAGVIYYFNGWMTGLSSPDGVAVKYTIASDTWSTATTQPTAKELSVSTLTGVDKFPLIGGDNSGGNIADVDVWDGSAWTTYTALPVAIDEPGGEVCGSYVYVVGGWITGPITNVYRAPLSDFTSTPPPAGAWRRPPISTHSRAITRAAVI